MSKKNIDQHPDSSPLSEWAENDRIKSETGAYGQDAGEVLEWRRKRIEELKAKDSLTEEERLELEGLG